MKKLLIVLSLILPALTGCASVERASNSVVGFFAGSYTAQFAAKYTIQKEVVAYIDQDHAVAVRVQETTAAVLAELQGDLAEASISVIAAAVRSKVKWDELDPVDSLALNDLINGVETAVRDGIATGSLPPDTVLIVTTVLTWANEAATLAAGQLPVSGG